MNTPDPGPRDSGEELSWPTRTLLVGPITILMAVIAGSVILENTNNPGDVLFDPVRNISVMYVTVRARGDIDKPDEFYTGGRGDNQQGVCNLEFEKFRLLQDLSESVPFHIPSDRKTVVEVLEMDPAEFRTHLDRAAHTTGGDIVVYIHGYNVGFEKSCQRAATFQHGIDTDHRMILFSWPADGNVLNYTVDEVDLEWSVVHLVNLLEKLKVHYPATKIHLVGHSLGARGLIKALDSIGDTSTSVKPKFEQLILLAPDADSSIFTQLFPAFRNQVKRTTLYASDNDNALKLSRQVHGYSRLGEAGEYLTTIDGLETIDVSRIGIRTPTGHLYHLYNAEVLADIKLLLDTDTAADSRPGLDEQTRHGMVYWQLAPARNIVTEQ